MDELTAHLDARHGRGKWLALSGGDRPGGRAGRECVGDVMRHIMAAAPAAVVAVQSDHMRAKARGVTEDVATHVLYYPAHRVDGAAVFGGIKEVALVNPKAREVESAHAKCTPVAATALYLGAAARQHLAGVVAFGGGSVATQECQFAVAHKVCRGCGWAVAGLCVCVRARLLSSSLPHRTGVAVAQVAFKYFPCRARKCLAEFAPFGELHGWAAPIRSKVREFRIADAYARSHRQSGVGSGGGKSVGGPATVVDKGVCLTMHQPWASLLVHGIKRVEGRVWNTRHRGMGSPINFSARAAMPPVLARMCACMC